MDNQAFAYLAAGLGAALTVFGPGLGIGRLAAAALEAQGRQPEAIGDIRTTMIIAAALIEGIALFALVICILIVFTSGS
jgi:F-type H+-transporting ATPase subunit c